MTINWNNHIDRLRSQIADLRKTLRAIKTKAHDERPGLDQTTASLRELVDKPESQTTLYQFPKILHKILHNPAVGAIILGPNGEHLLFNGAAERLLGSDLMADALAEKTGNFGFYLPDKVTKYTKEQLPWQQAVQGRLVPEVDLFVRRQGYVDGLWIKATSTALKSDSNDIGGAVVFLVDITEQIQVETQIESTCEALEQQISQIGSAQLELALLTEKLGKLDYLPDSAPDSVAPAANALTPAAKALTPASPAQPAQSNPPAEKASAETSLPTANQVKSLADEIAESNRPVSDKIRSLDSAFSGNSDTKDNDTTSGESTSAPASEYYVSHAPADVLANLSIENMEAPIEEVINSIPPSEFASIELDATNKSAAGSLQQDANNSDENKDLEDDDDSEDEEDSEDEDDKSEDEDDDEDDETEDDDEDEIELSAINSDASKSGAIESGATESGATESGATESGASETGDIEASSLTTSAAAAPQLATDQVDEETDVFKEIYELIDGASTLEEKAQSINENIVNQLTSEIFALANQPSLDEAETKSSEQQFFDPPEASKPPMAHAETAAGQGTSAGKEISGTEKSKGKKGSASTPDNADSNSKRRKILIVDDIPVNQKLLRLQLKRLGFECEAANNGDAAQKAISNGDFALVLMDLDMPIMDGFESTAAVRKNEQGQGRRVPIVAMTSYDRQEDREKCLAAGMDDFLSKGATQKQLHEVIERCINAAAAQDGSAVVADITPPPALRETKLDIESLQKQFDKEEVQDVSRLFLSAVNTFIDCIQLGIEEKDAGAVTHFAHSVKGPCAALGIDEMTRLTTEIMADAEAGNWTQVRVKYMKLKSSFGEVRDQLRELCTPGYV